MPEERRRREGGEGGGSLSRREGRDCDGRRLSSRSEREKEREPSPKRFRRHGKPASARTYSRNHDLDIDDNREWKHLGRFQDTLPYENSLSADSKHDECGSAGHGGQNYVHITADDGRSTLKEHNGSMVDKIEASDLQRKHDRSKACEDDDEWRHDGYFELEAEASAPRKRPAFSEKKMPAEDVPPTRSELRNRHDRQTFGVSGRMEKENYFSHGDELERFFHQADDKHDSRGDRYHQRNETYRAGYQSRERHGSRDTRGRETFAGRYGEKKTYRQGGLQVERWRHDHFDEANRSPTPKNEEEQIAKVEALLAL
ncbi:uncharacterized protein LOC135625884 isoform X1 [Musa acuminata AAA Group]|uniref:uncharacterized protein LOC135582915 isoform X1 n=1 Tax=Musa acuminata AAA Group TaxID=214697 RepID=UPI0031E309D3